MLDVTTLNNLQRNALRRAQTSTNLGNATSIFVTGFGFVITDIDYESIPKTDDNGNIVDYIYYPVFVVKSFDNTISGNLSIQSLLRAKAIKPYTENGIRISTASPNGTLSQLLRNILAQNRGKSVDELLPILFDAVKDKRFVVRERQYVTIETAYGDKPSPIAHIDIIANVEQA